MTGERVSCPTFNLVDEPWIEVLTTSGRALTVSIREAFHRSTEIRQIAGELPTQDVAVFRLLLAILYRALPVSDGDQEGIAELWGQWWEQGMVPLEPVDDYLDAWSDRFDLISPEHPFFQVADLETGSGNWSGTQKLIADLPPRQHRRLFTTRSGSSAELLSLEEAARWVVHCQAFDTSGIKTGALGDPRVKGGKAHPQSPGWTGNLGLVVVEGESLAESLLLNLVLTRSSSEEDRPSWEMGAWGAAPLGVHSPIGPVTAMTWQARRIRLRVEQRQVRDVLICHGDQIRVRNQHLVETMSGWRRSEAQQKKHKEDIVYMPRTHSKERSIWRGLSTLLAADPIGVGAERGADALGAANLAWLALLREHGRIGRDKVVGVHTVGMEYGTQSASVDTVISDRLDIRAEVAQHPALQEAAVRAVRAVEQVAYLLGRLADNLARAEGRDRADDQARRREQTYQQLDQPFRRWLATLSSTGTLHHERAWVVYVRREAMWSAEEMYAGSSPSAIKGRVIENRHGKSVRLDAAQAFDWFRSQLDRELPPPSDDPQAQPEESDDE